MTDFSDKQFNRDTELDRIRKNLRCVFVLSTGRVGTDTLTRLLDLSPEVRAHHEPKPRLLDETKLAYQEAGGSKPNEEITRRYLEQRLFAFPGANSLSSCVQGDFVYAETSNRLTYIAPQLANYFPKAKFIFLYRNPPAVIRSAMRRGYYDGHSWDKYRIEPQATDVFYQDFQNWSPFEKSCWYWKAVNEFANQFLETVAKERTFKLPSESIFTSDSTVLSGLFTWLGASPPSKRAIKKVLSVRHNAQVNGNFPKWPKWSEEEKVQMTRIVAPIAQQLGYADFLTESVPYSPS